MGVTVVKDAAAEWKLSPEACCTFAVRCALSGHSGVFVACLACSFSAGVQPWRSNENRSWL